MTKEKEVETKATSSNPVSMVQQAQKLTSDSAGSVHLPASTYDPTDFVHAAVKEVADEVAINQAQRAKILSEAGKIEADNRLKEVKRESKSIDSGVSSVVGFPGLLGGGMGAIAGGGPNRSALIATVLDKLPEEERIKFITENKDIILGVGQSPTLDTMSALKQMKDDSNGRGSLSDMASFAKVLSDSQTNAMLLSMQLLSPLVDKKSQSSDNSSNTVLLETLQKMVTSNQQAVSQLAASFTVALDGFRKDLSEQREVMRSQQLSLEERFIQSQRELMNERQEEKERKINEELERLRQSVSTSNLTAQQITASIQAARDMGVNVTTESFEQKMADREHEIKLKQLDIADEERRQRHELELARMNNTAQKVDMFTNLLGVSREAMDLRKSVIKGSKTASSLEGRVKSNAARR